MSMSKLGEQKKAEETVGKEVFEEIEVEVASGSDEGKKRRKKVVKRVKANKKLLFKPM